MREIMFRGKMDDGEWVYGWPFADTADCSLKKVGKRECPHDGSEYFIVEWADDLHEYKEREVIPDTVGQYTGLQDENEKKIFHGDIGVLTVFDHNGYDYQYKVEAILDDACGLCFNEVPSRNNGGWWSYVSNDFDLESQFEIIGNRWDNPELLEGEG